MKKMHLFLVVLVLFSFIPSDVTIFQPRKESNAENRSLN
jgi:hypothetical protein